MEETDLLAKLTKTDHLSWKIWRFLSKDYRKVPRTKAKLDAFEKAKINAPYDEIEDNISMETDLIRTFDWHNANHLLDFITLQHNGRIRQVEALNLVKNHLESVPDLSAFPNLMYLWLGENLISQIPDLTDFKHLQYLTLYHNQLKEISGIEKCA